jgi:hypothetical protein
MKTLHASLTLIFALMIASHLAAQEDWKYVRTRDGIDIYTAVVTGSSIYACKGVAVMNARIEEVAELIRDVPAVPEWIPDMKVARILSKQDNYHMLVYNVLHLPWPLKDRDFVVESKVKLDLAKGKVDICADALSDPPMPLNKELVRITRMQIRYFLEYIDREHTRVTLTSWSDPAGYLPAAIVNLVATKLPYDSLDGMRRMLKREKYVELGRVSGERPLVEEQITLGNLKP